MKLVIPFRVYRKAEHLDNRGIVSTSLILHPRPDMDPHSAARALWPNFPTGEFKIEFCDPLMVEHLPPGTDISITLDDGK